MHASPAAQWMANVKTQFLQLFGHAGTTITAQTEFVLLSNMSQKNHVITLTLAHGTTPPGTIAT
jgi:hypothetical protein